MSTTITVIKKDTRIWFFFFGSLVIAHICKFISPFDNRYLQKTLYGKIKLMKFCP